MGICLIPAILTKLGHDATPMTPMALSLTVQGPYDCALVLSCLRGGPGNLVNMLMTPMAMHPIPTF